VLLMDEPFGALDPVTRSALQLELKRVHQASGKTIVLVTHDMDEALLLATRIVLLRQGRVEQVDTPLALLSNPTSDFVADFLGRADIGLKLLSLQAVAPFIQPLTIAPPHGQIADTASVREALSTMAAQGVSALRVVDASGQTTGQVRAADLLEAKRRG